ncbi:MAG: hypothetical protein PHD48_06560 [Alphaproteobacteria bacterium]|nr:hypothetical protein [Alphaproteobacteria bacterium]
MKAVQSGRITRNPDGKIDPATADLQWERNSDPGQVEAQKTAQQPAPQAKPKTKTEEAAPVSSAEGPTYIQSRAIRELYVARLRKMEYEEKAGRLVPLEKVTVRWFNLARQLRDQLLGIPNRIDAIVAAENDRFKVNQLLSEELSRVLEEFSKSDPENI